MRIFFGGGEIGSHRTILHEAGARNVAMSYLGLRRRVKFSRPWLIEDKFEKFTSVFLDSGAYTVNADESVTPGELIEVYEHYQEFVLANLDRVDMVSEFDAMALGLDWIEEERDAFWSQIPREKFMAVWHPVWGISYLHEMASRYEIIGIPSTSLDGRELRPVLNALAAKGTRLHGVAMTKIDEMQSIRWDSVASTSWVTPQRFGDTIVWTGNELKRYPKKYKEQARKRHRTYFTNNGFDANAIYEDDTNEVLRLSVWSWLKFEDYINRHNSVPRSVTTSRISETPEETESPVDTVDNQTDETEESVTTPGPAKDLVVRSETKMLPVMGMFTPEAKEDEEEDTEKRPLLVIRSESARVCNSCFLAEKCPAYEPDTNCAYNIPIQIRTREQFRALHQGMLEMQTQRVMFMRFAEDMGGGYADPNLTKEISVLNKMMASFAEMEKEGFNINLSVSGRGGGQQAEAGMLSRIFGSTVGQQAQALPAPVNADDYIDVEVLEHGE